MKRIILIVLVFLWLVRVHFIHAQNLESIGKDKALTILGGLSVNQIVYTASGIDSRRDSYSYFASGNVTFGLYGWSVLLSFSLSNQSTSYQQPFNQYGMHPAYKWITGQMGYSSTSFSPYTLNGHIFKGGGVDLAPEEKFRFSAMYGRMFKAVQPDTLSENPVAASFKRMGYGFKAHYVDAKYFGEVSIFRAKDDSTSNQTLGAYSYFF